MTTVVGGSERDEERGQSCGLGESETTAKYWRRPTIRMKPVAPPRADRRTPRVRGATRAVLTLVVEDDPAESSHVLRVDETQGRPEDSVVGFWQPSNASFTIVVAASVALAVTALVTMLLLARTNAPAAASEPSETARAPAQVASRSEDVAQSPERATAASVDATPPAIPVVDVMSLPPAPTGGPAAR